jgi:hypothetical protein
LYINSYVQNVNNMRLNTFGSLSIELSKVIPM